MNPAGQFLDQVFNEPTLKDPYEDLIPYGYQVDQLVSQHSDCLLVTIGDSWTYGGSLEIEANITDFDLAHQHRMANVFGHQLAKLLSADWYNLSMPGRSNRWMINQLIKLCEIADQLPYKQIVVILTLTETCREFFTHLDFDIDYYELLKNIKHVSDVIPILSKHNADLILQTDLSKIKLIIGRNYVDDSYDQALDCLSLKKSWLDILLENSAVESPTEPCFVVGTWVFKNLEQIEKISPLSRTQILTDLDQMIKQAHSRINCIDLSKYNIAKAEYRHPTVKGHQLWAEYIFEHLKKN